MTKWRGLFAVAVLGCLASGGAGPAGAAELRAEMRRATVAGPGETLGTVTVRDGADGATVTAALHGLPGGPHGFHIHENGSCQAGTVNGQPAPAAAAGGHFDPQHSGKHEGPHGTGHLGDLPLLQAAADGTVEQRVAAPRIGDVVALKGKAVVIHAGGDNYSDQPAPLGGGGGRIACGILE
jgi:Cu-Zn family superoxide dismutase